MPTRFPTIPQHLAIIMDGNGRWAVARGLPRTAGHEAGAKAVRATVEAAREIGIRYLTLYAFSQENWSRPRPEVAALFELLVRFLHSELPLLQRHRIRLGAIGRLERLPEPSRAELLRVIEATRANEEMTLTLALSYGGRDELTDAARRLAREAKAGGLDPESITPETVAGALYTAGLPDPDLLVRTSGEWRLSNFLLWQVAYTELYVTDTPWPDFDRAELDRALASYAARERRFGAVP